MKIASAVIGATITGCAAPIIYDKYSKHISSQIYEIYLKHIYPHVYIEEPLTKRGKGPSLHGANYYPATHAWGHMWWEFNENQIDYELRLAENLGVNILRTFLTHGIFSNVDYALPRLEKFLSIAEKHRMKVFISLFDIPDEWIFGDIKGSKEWLDPIIGKYADDRRIYAWDINNELNIDILENPTKKEEILDWLSAMYEHIKSIDEFHPTLVSISDIGITESVLHWVRKFNPCLDMIAFNFYDRRTKELPYLINQLGRFEKPMIMSEFGLGTLRHSEKEQAEHYEKVLKTVFKSDIEAVLFWCLFDNPNYFGYYDNHHGVYKVGGTRAEPTYSKKPAADIVAKYYMKGMSR